MSDENTTKSAAASAYAEATKRLRSEFDADFRAILQGVYEERGITVRVRRSKEQALQERIAAARALLAENPEG